MFIKMMRDCVGGRTISDLVDLLDYRWFHRITGSVQCTVTLGLVREYLAFWLRCHDDQNDDAGDEEVAEGSSTTRTTTFRRDHTPVRCDNATCHL